MDEDNVVTLWAWEISDHRFNKVIIELCDAHRCTCARKRAGGIDGAAEILIEKYRAMSKLENPFFFSSNWINCDVVIAIRNIIINREINKTLFRHGFYLQLDNYLNLNILVILVSKYEYLNFQHIQEDNTYTYIKYRCIFFVFYIVSFVLCFSRIVTIIEPHNRWILCQSCAALCLSNRFLAILPV